MFLGCTKRFTFAVFQLDLDDIDTSKNGVSQDTQSLLITKLDQNIPDTQ